MKSTPTGHAILGHLHSVETMRREQRIDRHFGASVAAMKAWQHGRFERTYADLLNGRFRHAARFFLDDLYGPHDFSERDAQFARIVPAIVRLFPGEIVHTVSALAELHALSERLDAAMARAHGDGPVDAQTYGAAWREVGERTARERQITLMLEIGHGLHRYTRNPVLRASLRLMRGPAAAAGLAALQRFLERGFDTFRELGTHAPAFLKTIAEREGAIVQWLYEGSGDSAPPVPF